MTRLPCAVVVATLATMTLRVVHSLCHHDCCNDLLLYVCPIVHVAVLPVTAHTRTLERAASCGLIPLRGMGNQETSTPTACWVAFNLAFGDAEVVVRFALLRTQFVVFAFENRVEVHSDDERLPLRILPVACRRVFHKTNS